MYYDAVYYRQPSYAPHAYRMPPNPNPVFVFPNPGSGQPFPFPVGGPGPVIIPQPGGGAPFPGIPFPGSGGSMPPGQGGAGGTPSGGSSSPQGPPPSFIPTKPTKLQGATTFIDTNVIQYCLFRYTYVWLTNGNQFWFYPIVIGSKSIGGFTWDYQFNRPTYIALDTNLIDVVSCSY
ncbi:hypothetical protein [Bacillus sp. 1P06AnD]|uniref:hypothetical protein n=1 Tax=Bacillus sp. 1P06AnD TaxID=3132208 RepID=UPI00399EEB97